MLKYLFTPRTVRLLVSTTPTDDVLILIPVVLFIFLVYTSVRVQLNTALQSIRPSTHPQVLTNVHCEI